MLKFSANTGMLFPEIDFLDRFEACRASGFQYVEFPFPYKFDPDQLKNRIQSADLKLILFDLPVDDWEDGGRGCATDPGLVEMFREGVGRAVDYATVLEPKFLTCVVGKRLPDLPHAKQWAVLVDNLRHACDRLSNLGITLMVEIFNRQDNPGFFISMGSEGLALLKDVDRANFKKGVSG